MNAVAERRDPVVAVLDDLHLVQEPAVHEGVERLLALAPQNLTLVVCTRVDPPLPLGRLRVRGAVHELRVADLRFSAGDAEVLLAAGTGDATTEEAEVLWERTEGWAAGIVLAGISLGASVDETVRGAVQGRRPPGRGVPE
ncbi:MAG: hypothetical protein R2716_12870 [Microthrixaceae bacterium]